MRLISCSISEIAERRSYSDNYAIIKQFSESGMECAKIEEFTQKSVYSCASSLIKSIVLYRYDKMIGVRIKKGEVYLYRKDALEAK